MIFKSICFIFFLVMGAVYLVESLKLPMGTAAQPGQGFYPFLVALALISLCLPQLISSLNQKGIKPAEEESFPRGKNLHRIMALSLTITIFAAFLETLGYGVCSSASRVAILKIFGLRGWAKVILISLSTAAISYFLFSFILGVPLPRGLLFS